MRVLLAGGAGYVGSVVVARFLQEGHRVVVLDNFSRGHRAALPSEVTVIDADLCRPETLERALAGGRFDAAAYCAGLTLAGESVEQPGRYFAANVGEVIHLLNALVAAGVPRFLFSSSAAVYGSPEDAPLRETAPLRPVNPYGETKRLAESLLPWYEARYGLRWLALRFFNAAGAAGELGEDHRPETHLIPSAVDAVLGHTGPLHLYGTDYPTPDGTCIRDYVHVVDLAEAYVTALAADGCGAYNLGSGRGYSNRQVLEAVGAAAGRPVPVEEAPRRPGDPPVLVADITAAHRDLGWAPRRDLDAMVRDALLWRQAHLRGYAA